MVAVVPSINSLLHENTTRITKSSCKTSWVETGVLPMPLCSLASEIDSLEAHLTVELRPNQPGLFACLLVCLLLHPSPISIHPYQSLVEKAVRLRSLHTFPVPRPLVETSCPLSFPLSRVVG